MKCPACGTARLAHDTGDPPCTRKGEATVMPAVTGDWRRARDASVPGAAASARVGAAMLAVDRQVNAWPQSTRRLEAARDDMAALRDGGSGLAVPGSSGVPAAATALYRSPSRGACSSCRTQVRLVERTMNLPMPQLVRG